MGGGGWGGDINIVNEPRLGKNNNLHIRKQRHFKIAPSDRVCYVHQYLIDCCVCNSEKVQISFVTAKLISTFVFATRIVQCLFFLNPKFLACSHLLCLYSLVCVEPVRRPHCWFSHDTAQILLDKIKAAYFLQITFITYFSSNTRAFQFFFFTLVGALHPHSTAKVMLGQPIFLATLFPGVVYQY